MSSQFDMQNDFLIEKSDSYETSRMTVDFLENLDIFTNELAEWTIEHI